MNLGYINATAVPLKSFSASRASVLEFDAGDGTHAIGTLTIGSYGTLRDTSFSSPVDDGIGHLNGSVGTVVNRPGRARCGADPFTGSVHAFKNIGAVSVGGSVTGGSAGSTGYITSDTMIAKVTVGGSLKGGTVGGTGKITAGVLGPVFIGGDVVGTAGGDTGEISMDHGLVLAGYSTSNTPVNGGASIGAVKVGVDWIASSIVAGVKNSGFPASASPVRRRQRRQVRRLGARLKDCQHHHRRLLGRHPDFKLGSTVIPLMTGGHNDNRTFTVASEVTIHEV